MHIRHYRPEVYWLEIWFCLCTDVNVPQSVTIIWNPFYFSISTLCTKFLIKLKSHRCQLDLSMDSKFSNCLNFPAQWCLLALCLKLHSPIFILAAPSRQNGRAWFCNCCHIKTTGEVLQRPKQMRSLCHPLHFQSFLFLWRKGLITGQHIQTPIHGERSTV